MSDGNKIFPSVGAVRVPFFDSPHIVAGFCWYGSKWAAKKVVGRPVDLARFQRRLLPHDFIVSVREQDVSTLQP